MHNLLKPFLRGFLSKFKPFRELAFYAFREKLENRFLIVSRRDIDAYMLVDTSDSYGIDVLRRGKIETPEDKFIKKILKANSVVIDIGAHWGGFSILFGKLVGTGGKVYSFEASKRNFKFLKKNICINQLNGIVKPFNLAVGDENKVVKLKIAKTSSGHNSIIRNDLPTEKEEDVNQVKLDDFLNIPKVDLIKIDIEGYEYFALKGMENLIKENDLWLYIEFSPKFMGEDLTQKLYKFLKQYFNSPYIAYKKKIFQTDWESALRVAIERGQINMFLKRKKI
ncbi:FkbM family methyltransferase [Aquifex sp.]